MPKDNNAILNRGRGTEVEICLYVLGWIFIVISVISIIVIKNAGINILNLPMKCTFNKYLHIYCPGCGGTRAVVALLTGNIAASLVYHPFVVYGSVVGALFMISQTLRFLTHGRIRGIKFHLWFVYVGIAIILMQWIIKLALMLVFQIRLI